MSSSGIAAPAAATSSPSSTSPELEFELELLPPSTSASSFSSSSPPTPSPTMNRSGLGAGVSPECTISPLPRLRADLAGVDAVAAALPVRAAATPPAAAAPSAALLLRSFLTGDEAEEDLRAAAPPVPPPLSLKSLPTAELLARLLPLPRLDLEPMLLSDRATLFNDLVGDEPLDDATDGDGMTPRMMEYEPVMEAELADTTDDSPSPGGVTREAPSAPALALPVALAAATAPVRLSMAMDRSSAMALSLLLLLLLPVLRPPPARSGVSKSAVYASTNRSGFVSWS